MDKRKKILDTLLEMIAERGFHDSSMRELSTRSEVSVGNIYHYFPGKNDLIRGLYQDWQDRRLGSIMPATDKAANTEEVIKNCWTALFGFYTEYPQAFRFLEQFTLSPFFDADLIIEERKQIEPLIARLESGIARGEVRYMHPLSMIRIIFGHAASCSRLHIDGVTRIKDYQLDVVRQSCWDALRPMKY